MLIKKNIKCLWLWKCINANSKKNKIVKKII